MAKLLFSAIVLSLAILLLVAGGPALAKDQLVFHMTDPRGDDRGAGKLVYPTHPIFSETGILDIRAFSVHFDQENVYFDVEFTQVTNPFGAPEGYYHQRIELYVDTNRNAGLTKLPLKNYELVVHPDHGWEYRIKGAPFGGTELYDWQAEEAVGVESGLVASQLLADGKTIRFTISRRLLGHPTSEWCYYLLVGGFDFFSVDWLRPAELLPGNWVFGGTDLPIVDILAHRFTTLSQAKQLRSQTLFPVGPSLSPPLPLHLVWWAVSGVVLVLLVARGRRWLYAHLK